MNTVLTRLKLTKHSQSRDNVGARIRLGSLPNVDRCELHGGFAPSSIAARPPSGAR